MDQERRKAPRINVALEMQWEGMAGRADARLSDLSLAGCFVESLGTPGIGDVITLRIKLPTGNWLQLRGEVKFRDSHLGFGVAFSDLRPEDQQFIAHLIEFYNESGEC